MSAGTALLKNALWLTWRGGLSVYVVSGVAPGWFELAGEVYVGESGSKSVGEAESWSWTLCKVIFPVPCEVCLRNREPLGF